MYNIDDIKAGYLLEMDDGKYYTVNYNNRDILAIGNKNDSLKETYCDLMNFDDNLYCEWRKIKINKIYGRTFNGYLDFASPEDRKLLWDREEYEIGDIFIINKIKVQHIIGDYIKEINYNNVKAVITNIYDYNGFKLYHLNFDNNIIIVNRGYMEKLQKII
jgi:hypothetical protein